MKILSLLIAAALAAGAAAICLLAQGYYAYVLGTLATTALAGAGLNVLFGLAGEVSLGQAGFMALGAYGVAILTTEAGLGFWAALPLAVFLVIAVSVILSIPALRVTGPYLAMVTIAFGFIVESVEVEWRDLTGGASGITGIPAPFGTGGTALLACGLCGLALAAFHKFARSAAGLQMQAAASAPAAARSIGIELLAVRTLAFVLAAAAAGVAGGLQAALTGFIAPSSFPFSQSILLLLVVVLGGTGWTLGPLAGAAVAVLLPELLSGLAEYRLLVFGAGLLIVLWAAPSGIAGAIAGLRRTRFSPGIQSTAAGLPHVAVTGRGLEAKDLSVRFGGVAAVSGVNLAAQPGRITSVIGPNGAGKTTFLNLISGFQRPDAGSVYIDGRDITGLPAQLVSRSGLARTFQTAQLFGSLTVLENVRLGLLHGRWHGRAQETMAGALLSFAGYTGPGNRLASTLPHVDRRLVELARALATAPSVLLLDEPAAGLDEHDKVKLGAVLKKLAGAGLAVILVEHDMTLVMSISDHVVVLDAGRRIAAGPPAAVQADPVVKAAYLGGDAPPPAAAMRQPGPVMLNVSGLRAGYGPLGVLEGIDLSARQGETVAVLGPNGAGKSTLMKALCGLIRPVEGKIEFDGLDLSEMPAHRVARSGLILVPEGRQVFPNLTVAENLRLGATRRETFDSAEIETMLQRFPRLRPRLHTPAGLLSGGEQQMLAVARGLLGKPKLLLLDEPSLGLAPAVASELFGQLARLRDEGTTMLIVDQMADHVLSIAGRGYVLGGGRVLAKGTASELGGQKLADAYLGAGPGVMS